MKGLISCLNNYCRILYHKVFIENNVTNLEINNKYK